MRCKDINLANPIPSIFWLCLAMLFIQAISQSLSAQIIISSPVVNQVQQRNVKDSAIIAVTGYTHRPYLQMELRLEPLSGASNVSIQKVPDAQLSQGFFYTTFSVAKGWYRLSARASHADGTRDTAAVSRIGVGEVFLVAGNSNAMGVQKLGALSASQNVVTLDTVNKVLNADIITVANDEPMRTPFSFVQFFANSFSYPAGETSWLWGELGDLLYKRFGTPVLFLNAGWAAASSINYREAASGKDTFNNYVGKNWPYRQPYTNIPNTLRYFNSWLGIRAVLWSHGENDAYHVKINEENYFNNIKYLIQRTREDFGFNVPWVIGRHSVTRNEPKAYAPVINAQTALGTQKGFNTWLGPDTDTIQVPRPDHGHFENVKGGIQGLSLSAVAWNRSLPDTFFRSALPVQPGRFLHAGVAPGATFPGASFVFPFVLKDKSDVRGTIQAELLTIDGKFVAMAGTGKNTPLAINIPTTIPDGSYRLRLTATNPILAGTVSEPILVLRRNRTTEYVNHFKAVGSGSQTILSWVMAANPGIRQITIQKSPDRVIYSDLKTWITPDNKENSHVYAHTDTESNPKTVFYRIRMEYENGSTSHSAVLALFGPEGPPRYVAFPNPVRDQTLFVRPDTAEEEIFFTLYDSSGKTHPIIIDKNQIIGLIVLRPQHHLPAGTYILRVGTSAGISSQRVNFY